MTSKVYVLAVVLGLLFCPVLFAETFTINVALDEQSVDPEVPTVNNWSNDTIVVKIKGMDAIADSDILSTIDVPAKGYYSAPSGSFPTVGGRFVSVSFKKCKEKPQPCPDYETNPAAGSWIIYSEGPRSFVFKIFKAEKADDAEVAVGPDGKKINKKKLTSLFGFSIRVEQKPFGLGFSAGFSGFTGLKDKRYRLVSIAGDSENATLVPASDKDISYQLAAFAHYLPYKWRGSNGPAIGLAIDVPVENLTIMAGWTVAARTLPIVNTGYVTFGLAYAQRKRLKPEFEGRDTVPANLNLDTIVEPTYGLGGFVAISFGFFGGERQFKGVIPADNGNGGGN